MVTERERDSSVATLLSGIVADTQELVRQEIALARQEIREEIGAAKDVGIKLAIASAVLAIGALFLLMNDITSPYEHDEATDAPVRLLHPQLKMARTPAAYTDLAAAARLAAARAADLPDPIEPAYLAIVALAERAVAALSAVESSVHHIATTDRTPTSPPQEL